MQDSYSTQVSRTRRSQSVVFQYAETEIISQLEHRVSLIANVGIQHLERLVMVKYNPGDYFKEHHDGPFRSHTILLYLNGTFSDANGKFDSSIMKCVVKGR